MHFMNIIPFIGTSAGAACVFFMKKDLNEQIQRSLTGFAAGVMVAASMEFVDPCDRTVICNGKTFIYPRSSRLLDRRIFPAFTGSHYSTSSSAQ